MSWRARHSRIWCARNVPPGSTLLDFGCGTGVDALEYAHRGYRVLAYDNSAGMVAELERRCGNEIAAGADSAVARGTMQPSSIAGREWPAPNAVIANFAVLNSIRDLRSLFDTFAQRLAPPGWVIVSILNPIHWTKLKEPRWWLHALRPRRVGPLSDPTLSQLPAFRAEPASDPRGNFI